MGFAWPPRHRGAGALLPHHFNLAGPLARPWAVSFLWHFPAGFPGSALPTTLPCDVRTFLEGFTSAVAQPAPVSIEPNRAPMVVCTDRCPRNGTFRRGNVPGEASPIGRGLFPRSARL